MKLIGAWSFVIVLAGAGVSAGAQQVPPVTGDQSLVPRCAVAESATYAVTKGDPVKLGGGATTVAARERSYLIALRGPAGQAIRFKRTGSLQGPDDTILDHYEITYDGLEKPVDLYIDAYRWSTPKAPQGFVCGAPIGLAPPPPDPFVAIDNLAELAIEFGATGELPPFPLDPGGQGAYGVVFDRFRRIAQASKTAATAGKPLDPKDPPNGIATLPTVVVAYPLTCEGRTIAPDEIDVLNAQGRSAQRTGYSRGDDLAKLIGAATVPAGAVGALFSIPTIRTNEIVRITYRDAPCGSTEKTVSLPVTVTLARRMQAVPPMLPPGTAVPSTPLRLQVLIGPDGAVRFPAYLDGPYELTEVALAAVREWRYEPMRSNGGVIVVPINVTVPFLDPRGRSGVPAGPGGPGSSLASLDAAMATATFKTGDAAGLTTATSRCETSADPAYGLAADNPVKVGGGPGQGVAATRTYLMSLRGPAGQGLQFRRSLAAGNNPPGVEVYDLSHAGLTAPVRVFVDTNVKADLKAPAGFTCFVPVR